MTEGNGRFERTLDALLAATREQARAASSLAEVQQQNARQVDRVEKVLLQQSELLAAYGRDANSAAQRTAVAVAEVKAHVSLELAREQKKLTVIAALIAVLMGVGNFFSNQAAKPNPHEVQAVRPVAEPPGAVVPRDSAGK